MGRPKWAKPQNKPLTRDQVLLSPDELRVTCRKYRAELTNVAEANAVQDAVLKHFCEVLERKCQHFWEFPGQRIEHKRVRECERHWQEICAILEGSSSEKTD